MPTKTIIFIGAFLGSTVGGYIPAIWGEGFFSMSSILLSLIGGFAGIYVGYRIGQNL